MADDFYKTLQVDPEADAEVIEAAYRRLARKYHPDVHPSPAAGEWMKQLNAAYEVLRQPDRRARYDGQRATRRPPGADRAPRGCHRHPGRPFAGGCKGCGVELCAACAARFQPSACPDCVVSWARRGQLRAIVMQLSAALVVAALGGLAVYAAGRQPGLYRLAFAAPGIDTMTVAATVCSLAGAGLIGRALWELHRLRQVVAEALTDSTP